MKHVIADNSAMPLGDQPRAPHVFSVPLQCELALHLIAYARIERVKPETVIAEALRAYLGVDA